MKQFFKNTLYGYIYPSCTIFTLVLIVFTLIESTIASLATPAITVDKIFIILIFSLLLGLANLIFRAKKLNSVAKVLLHFAACAAAFILTFIVWAGYADNFSTVFMLFVAFCVIYIVIAGIYAAAKAISKRAEQNRETYKKQF